MPITTRALGSYAANVTALQAGARKILYFRKMVLWYARNAMKITCTNHTDEKLKEIE